MRRGQERVARLARPKQQESAGWHEGVISELRAARRVVLRGAAGDKLEGRCPQHIDLVWLEAALARGPVEAVYGVTSRGTVVVSALLPGPEHDDVAPPITLKGEHVAIEGKASVSIAAGRSTIRLTAEDGAVEVRGKNVTSRASETNRVKGGRVKLN